MITCRIGNPGYLYQRLLMTTLQPEQRNCSFLAEKLTTDAITSPAHKYHPVLIPWHFCTGRVATNQAALPKQSLSRN